MGQDHLLGLGRLIGAQNVQIPMALS
jgi:hypothetical protein